MTNISHNYQDLYKFFSITKQYVFILLLLLLLFNIYLSKKLVNCKKNKFKFELDQKIKQNNKENSCEIAWKKIKYAYIYLTLNSKQTRFLLNILFLCYTNLIFFFFLVKLFNNKMLVWNKHSIVYYESMQTKKKNKYQLKCDVVIIK